VSTHACRLIVTTLALGGFLGCRNLASPVGVESPSGATPLPVVSIGQPFDLRLGDSVWVDGNGLRIVFEGVSSDSRCPIDVQCIWEGDALVRLELDTGTNDTSRIELHTSARVSVEASFREYRVRLERLMPRPQAGVKIEPREYNATLLVTKPRQAVP
jgi:hypothetical protein